MRQALSLLLTAFVVLFGGAAQAQDTFPNRPINMVVPFPAGGPADMIARVISVRLAARLGQPIVVENRSGAASNIGAEYVARARADGYTLMFSSSPTLAINTSLYQGLKYNPLTSFEPLVHAGSLPNVLVVNADVPAKTLGELIKLGKQPGQGLSYASAGSGGTSHLAGVLFSKMTGVPLMHVPFKGTAPAIQALLGGHVTMTFTDVLTALPHIQSGKLRPIGVTSLQPSHVLPGVAPLADQGLAGFDVSVFFGLVAPKGLPPAVRDKLSAALQAVFAEPEVQSQLRSQGLQLPPSTTPAYLGDVMQQEVPKWRKLIQETGATPD
ncbi:Bug family tripartite tricarboxylate transporter substrate binding protein [Variovorax ureilyticus]|uniref:Bug family tripartite tricarboxylate transporter substrate binding protein n=1 Tax=Variovorax ureilyticus TaxID=1836198 RepID=UPI003D66AC1D